MHLTHYLRSCHGFNLIQSQRGHPYPVSHHDDTPGIIYFQSLHNPHLFNPDRHVVALIERVLHRNQLLLDLSDQGIDLNGCFTVGFLRCELGRVFSYCLLFGVKLGLDESDALLQVLDLLLGLL